MCLREGKAAVGVWLPLALADIWNLLVVVSRRAGGDTGRIELKKRSDILKSWMLPAFGAAVREDEDEIEAIEMFNRVKGLKDK